MLRKKLFGIPRLAVGNVGVAGLGVIDNLRFQNGEALFTAEDGTAALPQLTAAYEADGKHIISTVVREPNLEDVYLMSIGNVNADDGMFDKNSFRHVMDRSR
ncbi:MAG: hypothetical protein WCS40_02275 [Methanomethylophilus sp.]